MSGHPSHDGDFMTTLQQPGGSRSAHFLRYHIQIIQWNYLPDISESTPKRYHMPRGFDSSEKVVSARSRGLINETQEVSFSPMIQ